MTLMPLYTKFVKHTFESKPQPNAYTGTHEGDYTQNSSNTLLKANHNYRRSLLTVLLIIHKIRQTHF